MNSRPPKGGSGRSGKKGRSNHKSRNGESSGPSAENQVALGGAAAAGELQSGETNTNGTQWQTAGTGRRVYDKKKTKKEPHNLPPLNISSQPSDTASRANYVRRGNNPQWVAEEEQLNSLSERLSRSRGPRGDMWGGNQNTTGLVPRNPLVSRYEHESTARFAEEWRRFPEVPTTEELLRVDDVELPSNVCDGPYHSVEEYLSTHYELLREDAFASLREAVLHMREFPDSDDNQHITVYENTRILGLTFAPVGVCTKVSFSLNRAGKRIRWRNSKRLLPGSLVCLSEDEFNTFKIATVAARPLKALEEMNPPELDLLFSPGEIEIDSHKQFIMVEARQGYFEAYKWVLRALQRMTKDNFPLHQHICFLDKDVRPPAYVEKNSVFNLTSIFPDNPDKEIIEEVNILEPWPENTQTSMDKSQLEALKTILTKRVAVVQGPPGTGKTYTSVLALNALLQNMADNDPPIVVACQTNHALDQLLRHVIKFESNIVRLGGRTQDRGDILNCTLYNLRKKHQFSVQGSNFGRSKTLMERAQAKISKELEPLRSDLISPDIFLKYGLITEKQAKSFAKATEEWVTAVQDDRPEVPISHWLADSVRRVETTEDMYHEFEEADIDFEQLQDIEAEFQAGINPDEPDDGLKGYWMALKRNFMVEEPIGVASEELKHALAMQDVWELPYHLRAAVYCHLARETLKRIYTSVCQFAKDYYHNAHELKIAKMEKDAYILSKAKLIGMTATGLSKYRSLVASAEPKVILVEEAAEALEGPVVVACMPTIQHLILVGDHKQLRGKCAVNELAGDPYFLDISMFERWVMNDLPYASLRTQRRMRPEIRTILAPIYHDQLEDHPSVLGRDHVQGMGDVNLFWYCHDALEDTTDDTPSKCNDHEAAMIVKFVEYLILNAVEDKKITILTFYTGQKSRLYKKFRGNPNVDVSNGLKIVTVDSYQGEENDIVILSLVRSNLEMNIGFLSVENRVCVALSRAQRGFYIFGNGAMITRVDKLWWDVGDILNKGPGPGRIGFEFPLTCHKHKNRVKISSLSDWENINGGCTEPCKEFLPCGHICPLFCHPFAHELYRCLEICNRNPLPCGHDCAKACHDDCYCEECALPLEELQARADRESKLKDEELSSKAQTLTVSNSSSSAKLDSQTWPMPPRPNSNGHTWTRGKTSRA